MNENAKAKDVVIAVLDTGMWTDHPNLKDFILHDRSRWEKQGNG